MQSDKATNEVLQRIGRNVVLFQEMEAIIKDLLACGETSGDTRKAPATTEQRSTAAQKQTLGQLVEQLSRSVSSGSQEVTVVPGAVKGFWLSVSCTVKSDGSHYAELKKSLTTVVAERNELVHHLLPKFDLGSTKGTNDAIRHLDQQREKLLPICEKLKAFAVELSELQQASTAFFASDDCKSHFDRWFLQKSQHKSSLFALLSQIAKENARPDGWVEVAKAGNILQKNIPEEIAALRTRYGKKQLKEVLLATGLVEIQTETLPNGGQRHVYRMKPE